MSLAVVSLGVVASRVLAIEAPFSLPDDALKNLLSIFASSMLAVATFSVAAVVTAVSTVASSTTPRATRLVLDDQTTQTVLASFIAAFIYSMIALIAVEVVTFSDTGRLIIFAGFVAMVAWVLVTFVRWVDHVTKLGQMGNTLDRISSAALQATTAEEVGTFGAAVSSGDIPRDAMPVMSGQIGYVTRINVSGLQDIAEEIDGRIVLTVRPGDFTDDRTAMAYVINPPMGEGRAELVERIRDAVVVSWSREHHSDFRFTLLNLAETADRALSPAVNDPGTAIVILGRQLDALSAWQRQRNAEGAKIVAFDRVEVPEITARDVISDCFTAIARDGAGAVEVSVRLQKTLQALVKFGAEDVTREAVAMSQVANELAQAALVADAHKARVAMEAQRVNELSRMPLTADAHAETANKS